MTPHVLIVGVGKGSWQVRGIQIGQAIGARVTGDPQPADWAWADVCILVKRAFDTFAQTATDARLPIIWDAVDFWQQPDENAATTEDAIAIAQRYMGAIRPAVIIGATQAMASDLGGVCIPHHSRPRLSPEPVRERLQIVAYEGTPKYLGSWRKALELACARLGLVFVVNPIDLRDADVVVAFRGERWDGPICRRWKSGVKYANALAAGRPVLTQASAAFSELHTPGTIVEDPADVPAALDFWARRDRRDEALAVCRRRLDEFSVVTIGRRYRQLIASALQVAA